MSEYAELVTTLVGDRAGEWDRAGRLPARVLKELSSGGMLCPQVPAEFGGLGLSSLDAGELTAHVGSLCGSVRGLMTSQGMAATLDSVRVPAGALLGGAGLPLALLVTSALTYGRLSVAWGCVGILRACLAEATRHARSRTQFGKPIAEHQLIARHLAELLVAEQAICQLTLAEHALAVWS
jgi:alkylation response protein AidB-like acyl-CoA dehydrogenase